MQNISWSKTMGNWGKNDSDPVQKTIPVKEKVIQDFTKEKQELKGLKGQDRYFVKQMYQYRKDSLQKILGKWAKNSHTRC